MEKQKGPGGPLSGTPMPDTGAATAGAAQDLDAIQADSEKQELPEQDKLFRVAPRVRSKLHNLPDPAKPPLGFVPGRGFDVVFPFIKLPHLAPDLNGDWVQFGSPELEPNRLYYGDNLQVLRTLPSNSIDLIYIDPPFFSGAEYNVIWGDTNEVRTFSDIWEGGLDTYLIWLNARLWEMRRVLKDTGSIYVHCDWHASHYIKAEMDKIFGYGCFQNDVSWLYRRWPTRSKSFQRMHDSILYYTKAANGTHTFNLLYEAAGARTLSDYEGKRLTTVQTDDGTWVKRQTEGESEGVPLRDVWDVKRVHTRGRERIGYPTQKPIELLQRILEATSRPGDVVADFFVGGGSFIEAAMGVRMYPDDKDIPTRRLEPSKARRWIACDSSRVATSVTLNRLIASCEEMSGVVSNYGKAGQVQTKMDLPTPDSAVPDIRVHYVGVYPMDRFKAVDQAKFEDFILACLAAQADNSDRAITGWRSAREPLRVGPADPDGTPDARDLQAFFEAVLTRLQPNVRTLARYVCWRTSPELVAYRKRLTEYVRKNVQPLGADLDIDFLLIDSEEFRERIRAKYPDADEGEFLLRFTKEPVVGEIGATRTGARAYRFEARDADSTNAGGYLVNCQWDFDYQRGHFAADSKYVLGRTELKGKDAKAKGRKYEAVLTAEHTFDKPGQRTIACRVQDNLGAETIRTLTIEVA